MTRHLRQSHRHRRAMSQNEICRFSLINRVKKQRANEDISFEMWGLERRF